MNVNPYRSTSSPPFAVVNIPDCGHSNRSEWYFIVLICIFVWKQWCKISFHMLTHICVSSLVRCLLKSLGYYLMWSFDFLLLSFKSFFGILYKIVHQLCLLQLHSPSLWHVFFSDCLSRAELSNCNKSILSIVSFMGHAWSDI